MSAITFACIAVLVIVGLAVYAIHRKASLKVSAKARGKFEVNIEVTSQTGAHHGRLPGEPGDEPRSFGKLGNQLRHDLIAQSAADFAAEARARLGSVS